ncbi:hypothetical protein Y032_0164g3565 [Ancylostoma ceylanicum]|nr:hypothetical protein Y032_0164g3565 [Ancylostoma ceylanicum]
MFADDSAIFAETDTEATDIISHILRPRPGLSSRSKSPEENFANQHLTVLPEGESVTKASAILRAASAAERLSLNSYNVITRKSRRLTIFRDSIEKSTEELARLLKKHLKQQNKLYQELAQIGLKLLNWARKKLFFKHVVKRQLFSQQPNISSIAEVAESYRLRINGDKTKIMTTDGSEAKVYLEGVQLDQVQEFKYLGSLLEEKKVAATAEVNNRIGKASAAFASLKWCVEEKWHLAYDENAPISNTSDAYLSLRI